MSRARSSLHSPVRSGARGVRVPEQALTPGHGQAARIAVHRRSGAIHSGTVRCFRPGVAHRDGKHVAPCEIVANEGNGPRSGEGRRPA